MSRRYALDHKALVLAILQKNGGDVQLTSQQTGVPARTLRDWRRQSLGVPPPSIFPPPPPHSPSPLVEEEQAGEEEQPDPRDQFFQLRELMMREALTLATSLASDMAHTPVSQRASALTRLVDRILRLDDVLPRNWPEMVIRHEYHYPDGTLHDVPPWQSEDTPDDDDLYEYDE